MRPSFSAPRRALATGDGRAAGAVIAGGQQAAASGFLRYSRTQESAADAAALKYLDATGQSARGLLEFLEILADQNLLAVGRPSPYLSSHPLTADRINGVAGHLALSAYANVPDPPLQVELQGADAGEAHRFPAAVRQRHACLS